MAAETVRVSKLDCQPNRCAVQEPLTLAVHFAAAKPLPAAWWELKVGRGPRRAARPRVASR
jgi:hypothetical protein